MKKDRKLERKKLIEGFNFLGLSVMTVNDTALILVMTVNDTALIL